MSFVYYSLFLTDGLTIANAETLSNAFWTNTALLSSYIVYLTQLDFADYEARRVALEFINKIRLPKLFFTYSFDPLLNPIFPPYVQVRFPGSGTYVNLSSATWLPALQNLSAPLSYRDTDGPISGPLAAFYSALAVVNTLYTTRDSFFDRLTFEFDNVLVWNFYPPVNTHTPTLTNGSAVSIQP